MIIPDADTRAGYPHTLYGPKWQREHTCGQVLPDGRICGGRIIEGSPIPYEAGKRYVGCVDRTHEGLQRIRGWYERWKTGELVPGEIAEGIFKMERKRERNIRT